METTVTFDRTNLQCPVGLEFGIDFCGPFECVDYKPDVVCLECMIRATGSDHQPEGTPETREQYLQRHRDAFNYLYPDAPLLDDLDELEDIEHLGCPSYPCCEDAPNGCSVVMGDDVEWYGHRD
jgi:hypothetical protein